MGSFDFVDKGAGRKVKKMIMNVQQNAGPPPAYAPPPPQAAPAPVIIQQEKKSNTCCIVTTILCCIFVVCPVIYVVVVFAILANAVSNLPPPTIATTTTAAPIVFTAGGSLNTNKNICAGNFKYTATSSGSLQSPNYGLAGISGYYPANSDCTNRIESATNGVTFQITAFNTEDNYDKVVFTKGTTDYTFDGNSASVGKPQVGDRFSFSGSSVDVKFTSDFSTQASGFKFTVVDGYESANDVSGLAYTSRINEEDLPEKEKTETYFLTIN